MKNNRRRVPGFRYARWTLAALLTAGPLAFEAAAQVPLEIETQARLVDALGSEVTGPIEITVLIYEAPTGGTALWSHTYNTTAQGGVINLRLGRAADTPFPSTLFDNGMLWVTFKVEDDPEMTPRRQLASAPFAIRSDRVAMVDATTAFEEGVVQSCDIADAGIQNADLATGSVDTVSICDDTVQLCDMDDEAVDSGVICDGSVSLVDMNTGAVDSMVICDGSVALDDMSAGAVDSNVICDGTVAMADMGLDSIATAAILDGAVLPSKIGGGGGQQPGYVLTWNGGATWAPAVNPNSIGSAEIIDASITALDIAPMAIDSSLILNGTITAMDMGPMSVDSMALVDGAVSPSKLDTTLAADQEVLKYDTVLGVQWTTDGLSLPYEQFFSAGMPLLRLENMGSGEAIHGRSSFVGVKGELAYDGGPITFGAVDGSLGHGGTTLTGLPRSFVAGVTGEVSSADYGPDHAFGVYGSTNLGTAGSAGFSAGIFGEAYIQSGFSGTAEPSFGVCGRADGDESVGAMGLGAVEGVRGQVLDGTGLLGSETFGSLGLRKPGGETQGVQGTATASGTTNYGVQGIAKLQTSGLPVYGVYGDADKQVGGMQAVYGVYGKTSAGSGYGVFSEGDFGGTGAKYFVQPHPTDASREVRFVCLEGNESGTYFRGSGRVEGGAAVIEVPEEFRLVTEAQGLTVQLTPIGGPASLWVHAQDLDRILVRAERDVEFHYFVNGVRRGHADFEAIRENQAYRPRVRGIPYGAQYPEEQRRLLVENGILNPDFTPNEHTAVRLGWTLRDPEQARGGAR